MITYRIKQCDGYQLGIVEETIKVYYIIKQPNAEIDIYSLHKSYNCKTKFETKIVVEYEFHNLNWNANLMIHHLKNLYNFELNKKNNKNT